MNHVGNDLPNAHHASAHPQVRHVNLTVDTIITNLASDDIRTLVRALLSTSPAHVTDQFCSLAKAHLHHMPIPPAPGALDLFTSGPDPEPSPTPAFESLLARARARYGAGLGAFGILVLLPLVDVAGTIQWEIDSRIEDALAIVDGDISAALLPAKAELEQEGETEREAMEALGKLRVSLRTVEEKVEAWGGDFPFERSLEALKDLGF